MGTVTAGAYSSGCLRGVPEGCNPMAGAAVGSRKSSKQVKGKGRVDLVGAILVIPMD